MTVDSDLLVQAEEPDAREERDYLAYPLGHPELYPRLVVPPRDFYIDGAEWAGAA